MTSRVVVLRTDLAYAISSTPRYYHHITHFVYFVAGEGCITCHQEVTSWRRNQTRNDTDKIIVHIAGIP